MNSKRIFVSALLAGVLMLSFYSCTPSQDKVAPWPQRTHELEVREVDGVWKVVYAADHTKTEVIAWVRRGGVADIIRWKAVDSDVYFQFMDEDLFGKHRERLRAGRTLTLPITPRAKEGNNYYAVFVYSDSTYAAGSSPPNVIIERE